MRFLLIDKITAFEPGIRGGAVKNVSLSEDFFEDHFPLNPIMPGVLMLEGMAQLSGLLLEEGHLKATGRRVKALMSVVESAKFRRPAHPGDSLRYEADVISCNELGGSVKACAWNAEQRIAECRLIFSFHVIDNPRLERRRDRILSLWLKELNGV